MNNKRNVVSYIDKELVAKSRELGFNLLKTFENTLKQLINTYFYIAGDSVAPHITISQWKGTSPYPYAPSSVVRTNEPVQVTVDVYEPANASGVETVLFFYQVDGGQWWNTTMAFNVTSNLWAVLVPSQPTSCSVRFYIVACDKASNVNTSSMCTYEVNSLPIGDINGDGVVDSTDLGIMGVYWGETG